MSANKDSKHPDVVLIGAGIMSATLGMMLKQLQPDISIDIYERLDHVAGESSDAWNNAGTGHSAFCELNYTPEHADGKIDISKAAHIAESFERSKEFWSWLVESGYISDPKTFINRIPHMSFVWGEANVAYLRKRYEAMIDCHLFSDMKYTEDAAVLKEWMPLVMEHRELTEPIAATRMELGTDVNFGALTRSLIAELAKMDGVKLYLAHEVRGLAKEEDGKWWIKLKELSTGDRKEVHAGFIFIGAGGGALPLLESSGIPEAKGYGGFPVGGQWLRCLNKNIIEKHCAKVYGKAAVGAPPMSVPHLDTRIINGKKALLFGPYAGFSTKFLKHGSLLDLPLSISSGNIIPMISAGLHNIPLTKYLVDQVTQSPEDRLEALHEFVPDARLEDWELEEAGQRVQVIKKDEKHGGVLEFGTEIVNAADGSLAALLGASPGASTAVSIMVELLGRCFHKFITNPEAQRKLQQMIPSYGRSLTDDKELLELTRERTSKILKLR